MSRDRARYSTAWWQKLRAAVLAAEPLCRYCQADGRVTPASEVDHVVPLSKGGGDDWENLAPTCRPCHQRKTLDDVGAAPRGADADGMPSDPRHWWRSGAEDAGDFRPGGRPDRLRTFPESYPGRKNAKTAKNGAF